MDAVGGEFNAFTEKEHTCYYATVLDRDLPLAIDVISDVVLHATVTAQDVEVERSVVLEEIAMRDDDPSDLVFDEFAARCYGDTPLGRAILGTVESIGADPRAGAGYYAAGTGPARWSCRSRAMSTHAEVVRLVRRAFARRRGTERLARTTHGRPPARPDPVAVVAEDTEQANLVLGMHGMSRHDPRRFALGVLSAALGGGMSSRLFQRIREERGLAYSVYSFTHAYDDTGQFGVYAGCQPGKADEVLALMRAELDAVAAGG